MELIQKIRNKISKEFFTYLVIGVCTFLLDYFLYLFFLERGIMMNLAKTTSSLIAVIFNYLFNSRFNFGGRNKMKGVDLLLYILLYAGLIVIHVAINRGFYLIIGEERIAVFLAMCVSVFINYAGVKRFFAYTKHKNHVI